MRKSLVLAAFAVVAPATAQPAPVSEFLARINREVPPPERPRIDAAFTAMWERLKAREQGGCLPTVTALTAPRPATADRMIFNAAASGEARNGWTVVATLAGCRTGTQKFVLAQLRDDSLVAIPANEGESLTTSSQFRDTVPLVLAATLRVPALQAPQCAATRPERIVPAIEARAADLGPDVFGGRYAGSWSEVWTVHQCGHRVAVPVAFTADGDGGVQTRIASDGVKLAD